MFQIEIFEMKFQIIIVLMIFILNINQTPLTLAIRTNNTKIVELLLSNEKIDVNAKFILKSKYFINVISTNKFFN